MSGSMHAGDAVRCVLQARIWLTVYALTAVASLALHSPLPAMCAPVLALHASNLYCQWAVNAPVRPQD